jgi:hypothetical protein
MNLAIALFLAYIPFFVWVYTEYKDQQTQLNKTH